MYKTTTLQSKTNEKIVFEKHVEKYFQNASDYCQMFYVICVGQTNCLAFKNKNKQDLPTMPKTTGYILLGFVLRRLS